jgi:hypothetical protein
MCRVLNKREVGVPVGAVYIGRSSKWGNPFRIGPDGDRATVIAKHERWLADQHHLLRALDELRGRDLVCFCAPWPATATCCAGSPMPAATSGSGGGAASGTRPERKREAGTGLSRRGRERAPRGSIRPRSPEASHHDDFFHCRVRHSGRAPSRGARRR